MAANTPYNEFVEKILTATGSNRENPPASYFKTLREPTDTMEATTHLFLAVRFNCNKCHDHPFERWTQDQYYQTAAYFARVEMKPDPASGDRKIEGTSVESAKPLYEIIGDKPQGEVVHDRTKAVAPPEFPFAVDYPHREHATPPPGVGRLAHLGDEPLLRQELRQPALGIPAGRRASSSRWTTSAPAIRPPTRNCSITCRGSSSTIISTCGTCCG